MKEIIIALDTNSFEVSKKLIDELFDQTRWFKVGMEAFYSHGEKLLDYLMFKNAHVFLDLKLHDIPTTVNKSLMSILKRYPVDLINVHALGGILMLEKSMEVINGLKTNTKLIGVTILTSHSDQELSKDLKFSLNALEMVKTLNKNCIKAGLNGVVCSPLEAAIIKENSPKDYLIVTPGVRLMGKNNDQKRVTTPKEAFFNGSTHIVVGREVTQAQSAQNALMEIKESLT